MVPAWQEHLLLPFGRMICELCPRGLCIRMRLSDADESGPKCTTTLGKNIFTADDMEKHPLARTSLPYFGSGLGMSCARRTSAPQIELSQFQAR